MKKIVLVAAAITCVLSASTLAVNVYCPTTNQITLTKQQDNLWLYQANIDGNLFIQTNGQETTNQDKITRFVSANVFPFGEHDTGDITCDYSTSNNNTVMLSLQTEEQSVPNTTIAGNLWKHFDNQVSYCPGNATIQCPIIAN